MDEELKGKRRKRRKSETKVIKEWKRKNVEEGKEVEEAIVRKDGEYHGRAHTSTYIFS